MKKVISMLTIVAFISSVSLIAQEKKDAKDKATTEKKCSATEKKSCDKGSKKACCAAKKSEEKK